MHTTIAAAADWQFEANNRQKQQKHQAEIDNDDDVTNDVQLTGVQVSCKQGCVSITREYWTQLQSMTPAHHTKLFPLFPNHYFNISGLLPCCKKWRKNFFCPFVGAPVRPNMLNMPKSTSVCTQKSTRTRIRRRLGCLRSVSVRFSWDVELTCDCWVDCVLTNSHYSLQ